jgi:multidrug resistance protein, MATE family
MPNDDGDANDDDDDEEEASSSFDIVHDSLKLFHITLPTVLIQFSLFLIFPMAASAVGRSVGTTALGGLLGNVTCLSILEGALTAADTLMP